MKYNFFFFLLLFILFTGCGGGSSSDTPEEDLEESSISVSGNVVDGYLKYATVCLDLDNNGECSQNLEPIALTDENGSYTLDIFESHQKHSNYNSANIIAYDGIDTDTQKSFEGKIKAPYSSDTNKFNISPITTLVAEVKQKGLSLSASKEKVAQLLQVASDDLLKDPVEEATTSSSSLLNVALQLHKSIEMISNTAKNDDYHTDRSTVNVVEDIYSILASELSTTTDFTNSDSIEGLENLFQKSASKLTPKAKASIGAATSMVKNVNKAVSSYGASIIDRQSIARAAIGIDKIKTKIESEVEAKVNNSNFTEDSNLTFATDLDTLADDTTYIITEAELKDEQIDNMESTYYLDSSAISSIKSKYSTEISNASVITDDFIMELIKDDNNFTTTFDNIAYNKASKEEERLSYRYISNDNKAFKLPLELNYFYSSGGDDLSSYLNISKSYFNSDKYVANSYQECILNDDELLECADANDSNSYKLYNGVWTDIYEAGMDQEKFTLANNIISDERYGGYISIKHIEDLSGKTIYHPGLESYITHSNGAKRYYMAYKSTKSTHYIDADYEQNASNLSEFTQKYSGENGLTIDLYRNNNIQFKEPFSGVIEDGSKGTLVRVKDVNGSKEYIRDVGSWRVEKVDNQLIMMFDIENYNLGGYHEQSIASVKDSKVYLGWTYSPSTSFEAVKEPNYNKQALDDVIEAIKNNPTIL
jgi:hypothetical protein